MTSSIPHCKAQKQPFDNPWDDNEKTKPKDIKKGINFVMWNNDKTSNGSPKDPSSLDKGLKLIMLVVFIFPILAWLSTGFYTVEPDQEGVIIRFGKYHATTQPGLRYKFPDPIDKVIKVSVTAINREIIGARIPTGIDMTNRSDDKAKINIPEESQMLTGDENIIDLHFFVQWKIKDAYNYVFKIRDISSESNTLRLSAESAMREVMGLVKLNDAISEQRQDIERQARIILQKMLDEYQTGIEVVNLGVLYSYVPSEVKDAYRDIQAAKADKEREINQAYAYRNDILPKARGRVFSILEEAKGKRETIISEAQGQANKFTSIYNEYKVVPELTKKRLYIEAMESILANKEKILMTKGTSNSVLPLLPMQNAFKEQNNK
jgi:membrane protease subunit HflK